MAWGGGSPETGDPVLAGDFKKTYMGIQPMLGFVCLFKVLMDLSQNDETPKMVSFGFPSMSAHD